MIWQNLLRASSLPGLAKGFVPRPDTIDHSRVASVLACLCPCLISMALEARRLSTYGDAADARRQLVVTDLRAARRISAFAIAGLR
jgi:hypothetical protein